MGEAPEAGADGEGRDHYADRRQHGDGTEAPPQRLPVDMDRAGEQEEAEHPVHQGIVEVDLAQAAADRSHQTAAWNDVIEGQQQRRDQHTHHQEADIARQIQIFLVEPGETGGQQQQDGEQIKQ